MSLNTHSKFYYGFTIDETNSSLDFKEGAPEIQATIDSGSYTPEELAVAIKTALDAVGANTYTVSFNRTTRVFTISTGSNFQLLVSTGSRAGSSIFSTIGLTGSDRTGASTYSGVASGSEYTTQFILQDYVPEENFRRAAYASVNKSASGEVEVVTYGIERFFEMNFKFITDVEMTNDCPIRNNPNGISDFLDFIRFATTKAKMEFMPDEDDVNSFYKVILESEPSEKDGTGYKLKELYDKGLPGYYDSGVLKFRVVT